MDEDRYKLAGIVFTPKTLRDVFEAMMMVATRQILELTSILEQSTFWDFRKPRRGQRGFYRQGKHLGFKKRWKRRRK